VQAYAVARQSIDQRLSEGLPIYPVILEHLRARGLYTREHETIGDQMYDLISAAPMATEFAISRFLVPHLAKNGAALFVDADVMARDDLMKLFDEFDPDKAVMVVKHAPYATGQTKMDGQAQTSYARKNWSSVCLWNCDHPKTKLLTPDIVNSARGLWLHQFGWLEDDDIGELSPRWNWLVGYHNTPNPGLVHFTDGVPTMPGKANVAYASEWWRELLEWAR
jgi:hypothetical protein